MFRPTWMFYRVASYAMPYSIRKSDDMHSGWLVETASLWGYHGSTLVGLRQALPVEAVNEYWVRNRVRFDGWNSLLTRLGAQSISMSVARRLRAWDRLQGLIEEVLLAEPLARICVAVAAHLEERQIDGDARAILHNVYSSHCEVRNRCLKIIVDGLDKGLAAANSLNRTRHYLEHWTDMLLGYFANSAISAEYAFSNSRMEEFAADYGTCSIASQMQVVWSLQLASCRDWVAKHCKHPATSPRMNQRICEAAMGMIHHQSFDSLGCLRTRYIQSIENGINHADKTLASLESNEWESMSKVLARHQVKPVRFDY
ncbi:MAG: hypothetical protein ABL921_29880 [Pirellula sp.]